MTGGTGLLGRELVPALRAAGHGVRVLSRTPGEGRIRALIAADVDVLLSRARTAAMLRSPYPT